MIGSPSDHDVLIRVSTQLDRFEKDIEEIKDGLIDLPALRMRIGALEERKNAHLTRDNALIIAIATVLSTVIAIVIKLVIH
jgi:hypothetical protein